MRFMKKNWLFGVVFMEDEILPPIFCGDFEKNHYEDPFFTQPRMTHGKFERFFSWLMSSGVHPDCGECHWIAIP